MVAVLLVLPAHASLWVKTSIPHFRSVSAARLVPVASRSLKVS